jgi:hypothetical protein
MKSLERCAEMGKSLHLDLQMRIISVLIFLCSLTFLLICIFLSSVE